MKSTTADCERVKGWLSTVRICQGLDSEHIAAIAGEFAIRPFNAGETLASAGDAMTEFWIVVEGELDSFLTDASGHTGRCLLHRQRVCKSGSRSIH